VVDIGILVQSRASARLLARQPATAAPRARVWKRRLAHL
jgi:hypothetical protein